MCAAAEADRNYPQNGQLSVNKKGEFILKRISARKAPPGSAELREAVEKAMPERHIIDILRNVLSWTGWSRHWGLDRGTAVG